MMKKIALMAAGFLSSFAAVQAYAAAVCSQPSVSIVMNSKETVYSYDRDHCSRGDIPDSPAMAFINKDNQVVLFNGIAGSYASIGPDLNNVRRDCSAPLYTNNPDPNAGPEVFYNRTWLRDPWTFDGQTVYALVHNEYDNGPAGWFPNITAAMSTDGGKTFQPMLNANGKGRLAMVTPYKYSLDGPPQGIEQQSNILSRTENGKTYFYILVQSSVGHGHQGGTCLARTGNIKNPESWRAWDGQGFNTAMNVSLYRSPNINPDDHICKPINHMSCNSWTYNTVLNKYLAICHTHTPMGDAFAYTTSSDMIKWDKPQPLQQINWLSAYRQSKRGSGLKGQAYASLLDPTSAGRNFEYSGANPYLYYTEFLPKMRGEPWQRRDLVREKLQVSCND